MVSQKAALIEEGTCKLPTLEDDSTSDLETWGHVFFLFNRKRLLRVIFGVTSAAMLLVLIAVTIADIRVRQGTVSKPIAALEQNQLITDHLAFQCSYAVAPTCPALALFWNPEVHKVATENLMQVGAGHLVHADRDMVRAAVAASFRNMSLQLEAQDPKLTREISQVMLSESEKNLALTWLRSMSVPEVQRIGFEVALAIRQSLAIEPEAVKQHIELTLRANLAELKEKRDKLVSKSMLKFWGKEHQWEMTLDSENLRVMEAFHGGVFVGSDIYAPKRQLPQSERVNAVTGAVLEEGRALLDIITLRSRSAGWYVEMPMQPTSIKEHVHLGSQILSCELDGNMDGIANLMKALFCPLKFGSQGLDALRAIDDLSKETISSKSSMLRSGVTMG